MQESSTSMLQCASKNLPLYKERDALNSLISRLWKCSPALEKLLLTQCACYVHCYYFCYLILQTEALQV